ncbi:M23 family metallopeptidase [Chryseobacterium sp. Bi04]|uniref:M23 family metallopeptidase n=1 Tax=Chryseobacterium sp. Bi04 TaxID=2822345 RepID=UPI001DB9063C|nr:M23 family metallopeptidase [Chryseobacterium sp. Bi04]CAH0176871.1 Murein DD-endopeptidase MepM [Chryseobacterium sp. Bi04]
MNKFLFLFTTILSVHLFSQNKVKLFEINGEERDTVMYYSEAGKIYRCPFKKNLGKNKCEIKEELLTGTKIYEVAKATLKNKRGGMVIVGQEDQTYNPNYIYDLPYKKGEVYRIIQGYYGSFSHYNSLALDFDMPEGTEVLAARDGIVMSVVQNNNHGCATNDCIRFSNYISILHNDNTIAGYYHLQFNGAKVKSGDIVKKGMVIGLSGNTGWSSQPHLHFICGRNIYRKGWTQVKTLFRVEDEGKKAEYLHEGRKYLRDY